MVGFSVPGRESLIALGIGAHPGPILYCHIVQTWLPTACPVGSEAAPRERGGVIRNWANHSQSVYFRWKFYVSVEGLIKSCLGTSIFSLIKTAQQDPLSEGCPVFTLSKHSQCVNSISGGYAFKMPGHPLREMVLIPQNAK